MRVEDPTAPRNVLVAVPSLVVRTRRGIGTRLPRFSLTTWSSAVSEGGREAADGASPLQRPVGVNWIRMVRPPSRMWDR